MRHAKIIIVGFGPAGIACAIQLKRMGLAPLVIEKDRPGGLLFNANWVENYPGFPGGIAGPDLVSRLSEHAGSFNLEIIRDEVQQVKYSNGLFKLYSKSGTYTCNTLVVATGTIPIIPECCPENLIENGLIHFDISRLRQIKNKTIGIIGAGDAAFDYSLTLDQNHNKVIIFNHGNKVKALKVLSDKVLFNNNIVYLENITLISLEIEAGKGLHAIFNSACLNKKYSLDYLIFATGRKPANGFFQDSLRGDIPVLINEHRLYLAGDIVNGLYRQVSVAVGDGVRIAMEIFRNESNQ
jgi:thioredoxin reductase (NADPH)